MENNILIVFIKSSIMSLFFLVTTFYAKAEEIIVTGVYQGKNIYIQNPFASDKTNFCTQAVFVNGNQVMSNIKSSAFEVDLSKFALNTKVDIKIMHQNGCKPKILNAQVLRTSTGFQFANFSIDASNINWTVKGEGASSIYYVEQFINNNWITIRTINANTKSANFYNLKATHNSGINKYRIKHQEMDGQIFYTTAQVFNANLQAITFYPKNVSSKIYLSRETTYEVLNTKGEASLKGKGKEINALNLPRGVYYLNIDNRTEKFLKK